MKFNNLVIVLLLSLSVYSTIVSSNQLNELNKIYETRKDEILNTCGDDAVYIAKIAFGRDRGVSREEITEWVLNEIEKEEKAGTLNPSVTSSDALYQVLLIMWIYGNTEMTPAQLRNKQFSSCANEQVAWLDYVYEQAKKKAKIK